jgi:hypothetical protein
MNGIVDFLSGPGLTVFEVFKDINLAGSFRGILQPAVPETVIGKPVLPGAGFEYFVPGFGPGKFVFESSHRDQNLFNDI